MNYYFYKYSETDIKKQRAIARCLFKYALEKDFGITGVNYLKDERGKPYIPNSNLHMSISHCRAGAACVIADIPVGIDVEEISRIKLKIARRICTENELALLQNAEDKQDFLCRLWVLKEAYSKLTGKGFAEKFNTIDTTDNKNLFAEKRDGVYVGISFKSDSYFDFEEKGLINECN
ncbi:MAG: 4'-phosphopantetheinyl transferase superfamily protein [Oscillospiraceae bacterium]|nr:4'-phosphopantetheinyl transferase superfamily protein [Oscillospiraceae bacterium]